MVLSPVVALSLSAVRLRGTRCDADATAVAADGNSNLNAMTDEQSTGNVFTLTEQRLYSGIRPKLIRSNFLRYRMRYVTQQKAYNFVNCKN
jgi:hypothetical protein